MGNGRRNRKNIRNFNPDDVKLVMARLEIEEDTLHVRFTCTYVKMVERKGNMVLLESPETGIKKWINLHPKTDEDCINGMIFDSECKNPLIMTFTTIDEDTAKEALSDVVSLLMNGEDYEDEDEGENEDENDFSTSEEQEEMITNLMIERGIIQS